MTETPSKSGLKRASRSAESVAGRSLNIVYFVDANRTRSLSLPLKRVRWILAFGGGVLVWAGLATYWSVRQTRSLWLTQEDLRGARKVVFDYQARFDNVYDEAYPVDSSGSNGDEELIVDASPASAREDTAGGQGSASPAEGSTVRGHSAVAPATSDGGGGGVATDLSPPSTVAASGSASTPGGGIRGRVTVAVAGLNVLADRLELSVVLRNSQPSQRAEGLMWAVATWVDAQGAEHYVATPASVRVGPGGEVVMPQRANRFRIMNFKQETLVFPNPGTGQLRRIRVSMVGKGGDRLDFDFDQDAQLTSPGGGAPPLPTTPVKTLSESTDSQSGS